MSGPLPDRFASKVDFNGPDGCWLWTASDRNGYGAYWHQKRVDYAHRVAWMLLRGTIPDGLYLDHICFQTRCVNPDHLRIVTNKQNGEHLRGARPGTTSGRRGVYWHARAEKWCVSVKHYGRVHHGGSFVSLEEAAQAASDLRRELFTHSLEGATQ